MADVNAYDPYKQAGAASSDTALNEYNRMYDKVNNFTYDPFNDANLNDAQNLSRSQSQAKAASAGAGGLMGNAAWSRLGEYSAAQLVPEYENLALEKLYNQANLAGQVYSANLTERQQDVSEVNQRITDMYNKLAITGYADSETAKFLGLKEGSPYGQTLQALLAASIESRLNAQKLNQQLDFNDKKRTAPGLDFVTEISNSTAPGYKINPSTGVVQTTTSSTPKRSATTTKTTTTAKKGKQVIKSGSNSWDLSKLTDAQIAKLIWTNRAFAQAIGTGATRNANLGSRAASVQKAINKLYG